MGILSQFPMEPVEALPLSQAAAAADAIASPTDTPITVTIHFTAKPQQSEALVNQMTQALSDARQAPGCRYAQVYVMADAPKQVVLCKGWDSRSAQTQYLKWEQSSGRLAKLLALVEDEPRVEYWEFQSH